MIWNQKTDLNILKTWNLTESPETAARKPPRSGPKHSPAVRVDTAAGKTRNPRAGQKSIDCPDSNRRAGPAAVREIPSGSAGILSFPPVFPATKPDSANTADLPEALRRNAVFSSLLRTKINLILTRPVRGPSDPDGADGPLSLFRHN